MKTYEVASLITMLISKPEKVLISLLRSNCLDAEILYKTAAATAAAAAAAIFWIWEIWKT